MHFVRGMGVPRKQEGNLTSLVSKRTETNERVNSWVGWQGVLGPQGRRGPGPSRRRKGSGALKAEKRTFSAPPPTLDFFPLFFLCYQQHHYRNKKETAVLWITPSWKSNHLPHHHARQSRQALLQNPEQTEPCYRTGTESICDSRRFWDTVYRTFQAKASSKIKQQIWK